MSFSQMKSQEAQSRVAAIRKARRSPASSSIYASPDLLRFAAGFRMPVKCAHHHPICYVQSNVISGGFLELESR